MDGVTMTKFPPAKDHPVLPCFVSCAFFVLRVQNRMKLALIVTVVVCALVFLLLPDNSQGGKTKKGPLVTEKVCFNWVLNFTIARLPRSRLTANCFVNYDRLFALAGDLSNRAGNFLIFLRG